MTGISLSAVLVAAVGAWIVGSVWYGVLSERWVRAVGKTRAELMPAGRPNMVPMVLSFVGDLILAFVLAVAIEAWTAGAPTMAAGIAVGATLWFGFAMPAMAVNNAFVGRPAALTLIDGGHWLAATVVAGAIIGAFG